MQTIGWLDNSKLTKEQLHKREMDYTEGVMQPQYVDSLLTTEGEN